MFFINYLFEDPAKYFTVVLVVIGSIVLHELGHALAATWEGDPTPRMRGHLTWNPVIHMGWLSIGLAAVIGLAWGLTPVTPAYFRHRRWGEVIVSFAGPAVNLLLAVVSALVLVFVVRSDGHALVRQFWSMALLYNVALFILNMIPVPPLDGFTIVGSSVNLGDLGHRLRALQPWPILIVFVLLSRGPFWQVAGSASSVLYSFWAALVPGGA